MEEEAGGRGWLCALGAEHVAEQMVDGSDGVLGAMKKERSSAALLLHCFFDVGGLEHFFGIYALFAQFLEFCYYLGTVRGIGDAEPLGGGGEDFAGGGAGLD